MVYDLRTLLDAMKDRPASDLAAFRKRLGAAFFLYSGRAEDLKAAHKAWQPTLQGRTRRIGGGAPEDLSRMLAYPLPDASADPGFLSVGRVDPNTIILNDESVSVFHAVITRSPRGEFLIQDAGSTNGTFLNDQVVLAKQYDRPSRLRSNDTVRFGSVVLTFLLPPALFNLLNVLAAVVESGPGKASSLRSMELFNDVKQGSTGQRPLSEVMVTVLDGVQLLEEKRYRLAIEKLTLVLEQVPGNRSAQIWLKVAHGRWHFAEGDPVAAAQAYRDVLVLDPAHPEALNALKQLGSSR